MKKRILSIAMAIACVAALAVTAVAAPAGYSDYGVSDTKVITAVEGDTVELMDTTNGTSIEVPKDVLPATVTAVTLASKPISKSSETYKAVKEAAKDYSDITLLDIQLLDQDGNAITALNGKVSVTVKVVGDANTVLYFNDADNSVENLGGTVKDGFITFETSHFSYYAMAKTATTGGTTTPSTGDAVLTTVSVVAVMAIVVLGTTLVAVKMKKSKKED